MTIAKVFIEQEKQLELNQTDFKQLINSLVREIYIQIDVVYFDSLDQIRFITW
jgi:hypothetical protein